MLKSLTFLNVAPNQCVPLVLCAKGHKPLIKISVKISLEVSIFTYQPPQKDQDCSLTHKIPETKWRYSSEKQGVRGLPCPLPQGNNCFDECIVQHSQRLSPQHLQLRWHRSLDKGSMVHMEFTKFSGSSFTLETGGTVATDSLEELALNLRKRD